MAYASRQITAEINADPDKILQLCHSYFPSLTYEVGVPGKAQLVAGRDNRDVIATLIDELSRAYPEAGRHYWSIRAWGLMIWQPVMLTISALHLARQHVNLNLIGQHVMPQMIAGATFPKQSFEQLDFNQDISVLINYAGLNLRACSNEFLGQLGDVMRVNRTMARLLLADRILATVITLRPLLPSQEMNWLQETGYCWLKACDLERDSDFLPYETPQGDQALSLDRKGCCQHFRRSDGRLCLSCPRQSKSEILRRLYDEWSPHAGVE